ncbi:hypothetical protein K523DRAFT_142203, partial [Schizophyllum commune Tattone D]
TLHYSTATSLEIAAFTHASSKLSHATAFVATATRALYHLNHQRALARAHHPNPRPHPRRLPADSSAPPSHRLTSISTPVIFGTTSGLGALAKLVGTSNAFAKSAPQQLHLIVVPISPLSSAAQDAVYKRSPPMHSTKGIEGTPGVAVARLNKRSS